MKKVHMMLLVGLVISMVLNMSGCCLMFLGSEEESNSIDELSSEPDISSTPQQDASSNVESSEQDEGKILVDNEIAKIVFKGNYNVPGIGSPYMMDVTVENKSNENIRLSFKDVYLNGKSIQMMDSDPNALEPGKISECPFHVYCKLANIEDLNEVKKIEFVIVFIGSGIEELGHTDKITLTF